MAILDNKHLTIRKTELTEVELSDLQEKCSYVDKAVEYQVNQARRRSYPGSQHALAALKKKMVVRLYSEDEEFIVIPQGLVHCAPSSLQIKDERALPKKSSYLWHKTPPFPLRYYQREAVDSLKGHSRGQLVLATGTGKSWTMLTLVKEMGLKTLVICPSSMIGSQLYDLFCKHLGKKAVGMYGAGKKEIKQVTVALYQSVAKNAELFSDVEMVVTDENQTLGAGSLVAITSALSHVPFFFSVSATNFRTDGRTPEIYAASGDVRYSFDTKRAIQEKFLAQPVFSVAVVESKGGQHDLKQKNYTEHVVKNEVLNQKLILDAEKVIAKGMSTLILVQEIEHGQAIATALGLPFANGEDAKSKKYIDHLNAGTIKGLVAGAQMCGIGVDTVRVDCLMMCSFPGSEGLTLQLLGRGLRMYPGKKKVLVLDYIPQNNDMLRRHGEQRVRWYEEYGPVQMR